MIPIFPMISDLSVVIPGILKKIPKFPITFNQIIVLRMSFEDYKRGVIAEYQRRKMLGKLSPNLSNPSPGKIRSECLTVYDERYLSKDDQVLRLFFGASDQKGDYRKKIEKFEVDGFRAFVNYLNGKTTNPDEKNVKLLSWLINYDNIPQLSPIDLETKKSFKPLVKFNSKNTLAMLLIFSIASFGTYLVLKDSVINRGKEKCMYWDGNEYLQVSCSQRMEDKLVIALDSAKLTRLRKISDPDTITHKSIGRVWYVKFKGRIEYYTDSGYHPIEINKRLLPITDYMINKYIFHL